MNKNTIKVTLAVDDQGTAKITRFSQAVNQAGSSAQSGFGRMSSAGGSASKSMSMVESTARSLLGVVKMLVPALAGLTLLDLVRDSAMMAAQYETMGVSMRVVGNNAGYTGAQMEASARSMQSYGISMVESRTAAMRLASAHINLSQATALADVARNAAVANGQNTTEAFMSMIHGIQAGEKDVLETIGINVSWEQSYRDLEKQLGRNRDGLTELEKIQARVNAVLASGKTNAGVYEEALGTAGKMLLSLQRLSDNLKTSLGDVFGPAVTTLATSFYNGLKQANEEVGNGGSAILKWQVIFQDSATAIVTSLSRIGENINTLIAGGVMLLSARLSYLAGTGISSAVASTVSFIAQLRTLTATTTTTSAAISSAAAYMSGSYTAATATAATTTTARLIPALLGTINPITAITTVLGIGAAAWAMWGGTAETELSKTEARLQQLKMMNQGLKELADPNQKIITVDVKLAAAKDDVARLQQELNTSLSVNTYVGFDAGSAITGNQLDQARSTVKALEEERAEIVENIKLTDALKKKEQDRIEQANARTGKNNGLTDEALKKLRDTYLPTTTAAEEYKKALEDIEKAKKSGQLKTDAEYSEALKTAKDRLDQATGATAAHKKALSEQSKEAKKSAKEQEEYARYVEQTIDRLLPLRKEEQDYGKALAAVNQARSDGTITAEQQQLALQHLDQEMAEARKQADSYAKALKDAERATQESALTINGTKIDIAIAQGQLTETEALPFQVDLLQQKLSLQQQILSEMQKSTPEEITAWNSQAEAIQQTTLQLAEYQQKLRLQDPYQGMVQGLKDVAEQSRLTGEDVRDYIVGAFDQANDALADFVFEGESFSGLFKSLSRDAFKLATNDLVMSPLAGLLGGSLGGSSASSVAINAPAMVSINGGSGGLADALFPDATATGGSWWDTFFSESENTTAGFWDSFSAEGESAFGSIFSGIASLFGGSTVTGGDGLLSFLGFHAGGTVTPGGQTFIRTAPVSLLSNAPRYHTGLMSDEFAAILQRNENVLTENQTNGVVRQLDTAARLVASAQAIRTQGVQAGAAMINQGGSTLTISVPVSVDGGSKKMAAVMQREIESTVKRVVRELS